MFGCFLPRRVFASGAIACRGFAKWTWRKTTVGAMGRCSSSPIREADWWLSVKLRFTCRSLNLAAQD
jgi:hypothetical protein